jgi:hypothetical protein
MAVRPPGVERRRRPDAHTPDLVQDPTGLLEPR